MPRFFNYKFFSDPSALLLATFIVFCGSSVRAQSLFSLFDPFKQNQIVPRSNESDTRDEGIQLSPHLRRQTIDYPSREAHGTIIIDTPHAYLYYVLGNGKAIRYGIGVGREGFTWSGVNNVARKAEWPDWYPPARMIARQPYLPRMIAGGPGNPLGARAMYIGNTEYRIHGTNDPTSIGKHVSSGCIRLTNEDVKDLYNRVQIGAKVIVLPQNLASQTYAQPPSSRTKSIKSTIHPATLY